MVPLDFKTLIEVILEVALLGFIVWLITTYIPMPDILVKIIYVIVAVAAILWLLTYIN